MYTIFNLRNYADKLMSNGYNVDKDAMNQFVQDYSLYREICLAAERWITKTDEYIALLASNYNAKHGTNPNAPEWRPSYWGKGDTLPDILSRLEFLSVPLDIYD